MLPRKCFANQSRRAGKNSPLVKRGSRSRRAGAGMPQSGRLSFQSTAAPGHAAFTVSPGGGAAERSCSKPAQGDDPTPFSDSLIVVEGAAGVTLRRDGYCQMPSALMPEAAADQTGKLATAGTASNVLTSIAHTNIAANRSQRGEFGFTRQSKTATSLSASRRWGSPPLFNLRRAGTFCAGIVRHSKCTAAHSHRTCGRLRATIEARHLRRLSEPL